MAEQLFQIGVKAVVRNQKGEILMVHIPDWGDNPAHWDLPGGRMDPGENFLQTLRRELEEEIGQPYVGEPEQMAAMLTSITIPVGGIKYPLVFVIYNVRVADTSKIKLDPDSAEDEYAWFSPEEAADKMAIKFTPDFRDKVRQMGL